MNRIFFGTASLLVFTLYIQATNAADTRKMSVVDFIVDYDTLGRSEVQVDGYLMASAEMSILFEEPGSMTSIFIEASVLPREQLRHLLTHCGGGCDASIVGRPAQVMYSKGMAATRLIKPHPRSIAPDHPIAGPRSGTVVSVADLLADYDSLVGKRINVRGFLFSLGESLILYEEFGSMVAVFVDFSALSREDRRSVLQRCSSGCEIVLRGATGQVMGNEGIIATGIGGD